MDRAEARKQVRGMVGKALGEGDAYGWNETLYRRAAGKPDSIPWAECVPNPHLEAWLKRVDLAGYRKDALVVGCGLGDDAELLARSGFEVTAFDVSATAIGWCRERFPDSRVKYAVADLFSPSAEWAAGFGFVLEAYTLQTFPQELRSRAIRAVANLVASGGRLLVIARGRDPGDPKGEFPWPLTREELDVFQEGALVMVSFKDFVDAETPPVRRFLAEYARPPAGHALQLGILGRWRRTAKS